VSVTETTEQLAQAAELYIRSRPSDYFGPNDVKRIIGASQVWVNMTKPDSTPVRFICDCVMLSCRKEHPSGSAGAYSQPFIDDCQALVIEMGQAYIASITDTDVPVPAYVP
jgi:hypothetical protein